MQGNYLKIACRYICGQNVCSIGIDLCLFVSVAALALFMVIAEVDSQPIIANVNNMFNSL